MSKMLKNIAKAAKKIAKAKAIKKLAKSKAVKKVCKSCCAACKP